MFRPLPPSPLRFTVSGNEIVTLRFSPLFRPRIARPSESLSPLFRPRIARPFESLSPRQRFELRLKATQKQGVRRDRRSLFSCSALCLPLRSALQYWATKMMSLCYKYDLDFDCLYML